MVGDEGKYFWYLSVCAQEKCIGCTPAGRVGFIIMISVALSEANGSLRGPLGLTDCFCRVRDMMKEGERGVLRTVASVTSSYPTHTLVTLKLESSFMKLQYLRWER